MLIVDCDVHVHDALAALAPHCDPGWRPSLEALADTPARYLDIPGYAPSLKLDPPIPGGQPVRSVPTAAAMRDELSALGIDVGILFPDNLLLFAAIPNQEHALALGRAYNRWLLEEWLHREPGLYGVLLACPQDPEASAREIERYAAEEKVVGVFLPTAGGQPALGGTAATTRSWRRRRRRGCRSACTA